MIDKPYVGAAFRLMVGMWLGGAAALHAPLASRAEPPANLPISASSSVTLVSAEYATQHFLKEDLTDGMLPNSNNRFVLIPRSSKTTCDILRMVYKVQNYRVIVSSTRWLMLIQIVSDSKTGKLMSVPEIKDLDEQVFKWRGDGTPPPDRFASNFTVVGPGNTRTPITDLSGNPQALWFQKPGMLASYQVNWDNLPNRPTQPSLDLWPNSRFFTARPDEEKVPTYWMGFANGGKQILLDDLVAPQDDQDQSRGKIARDWCMNSLSGKYQVPTGLEFVSVPKDGIGGVDTLQVRYSVGNQIVTVESAPTFGILQVEQTPSPSNPKVTLSEEKVEDLVHSVFADSAAAVANANQGSESEGSISVSPTSKFAWLNSVKWWQEPGRLVFYWKKTGGQKAPG